MSKQKQGIIILGSTGSIGKSTLSVIEQNPDLFRVDGLSCQNSIKELALQIERFSPKVVATGEGKASELKQLLGKKADQVEILEGRQGYIELAKFSDSQKLVAAMVGAAGIEPVLAGIQSGKTIALANKESLVLAGSLLLKEAKKHSVNILPIDSEHNAVFQSLYGEKKSHLEYITLTASGGPFRTWDLSDFSKITLQEALNHPNWDMGRKITIDSATMMNKCLEIIEAKWLFDIEPQQIHVLIHPQSIVHSMVTYRDASTICQMGTPDMRIPIANCLGYPDRIISGSDFLNLAEVGALTFEAPDFKKFPTIQMAYDVLKMGGGAPAALNGSNEILVEYFLNQKIKFTEIFEILSSLVQTIKGFHRDRQFSDNPFLFEMLEISDAIRADQWGREFALQLIDSRAVVN
ncbi:MAG: 1-deoxy-D-xylulose-5-phosphate reductoisomerase [Proteobacteria bacterium]|nr:1-deoxy-D-xylulose-5-phosphate reductoisomerase [Pseudomonadota bacterium]